MQTPRPFPPLLLVLAAGALLGGALGARHAQGLFIVPLSMDSGVSRASFAFALALQNLVWGAAQPFTGWLADRWGSRRVLAGGCLLYAAGLWSMAGSTGAGQFVLSAGLMIGVALSCTSFTTVYGALSRILPPSRRAWGLALAGAAAGVGQFCAVPFAQGAIDSVGAAAALVVLAVLLAGATALALPLNDRREPAGSTAVPPAPLGGVLRLAAGHRDFWMLGLGFLACGFQLAFIATHLPAYLLDRGADAGAAVVALSLIALGNVAGTYAIGMLGSRYRKAALLALIYLARSLIIAAFVWAPLTDASLYLFAFAMGLLWLGTVPLTTGIVSQKFGVTYVGTLFGLVFFGHQLGSFLGVWLAGLLHDATGSYDLAWQAAIAIGIMAALIHWPIAETPVDPGRKDHARPAGVLLTAFGLAALSAWAFLAMLEPGHAVTLLAAQMMCG